MRVLARTLMRALMRTLHIDEDEDVGEDWDGQINIKRDIYSIHVFGYTRVVYGRGCVGRREHAVYVILGNLAVQS